MCNPIANLGFTDHPTFLSLVLVSVTEKVASPSENPVTHQGCNVLLEIIETFSDNRDSSRESSKIQSSSFFSANLFLLGLGCFAGERG